MPRTAPAPNVPIIPGMNPGVLVSGGGGAGGGAGAGGGNGKGGKKGADGQGGENNAQGGDKHAPNNECTQEGHPVDVATGRVFTEVLDFKLKGVFSFEWTRYYSSTNSARADAGLGFGWTHSYSGQIFVKRRSVVFLGTDGVPQTFPRIKVGQSFKGRYGRILERPTSDTYVIEFDGFYRHQFAASKPGGSMFRLASVNDRRGNAMRLNYQNDLLVSLTDTVGQEIRVVRSLEGLITALQVLAPDGGGYWVSVCEYRYSSTGDLVETLDPEGNPRRYTYKNHLLVEETNRNGLTFYFRYDRYRPSGRCLETWGSYPSGDPALASDLNASVESDMERVPAKGIYHRLFNYYRDETVAFDTRSLGRRYRANAAGIVEMSVNPSGKVTTYEYDQWGNTVRTIDENQVAAEWERDDEGRVVSFIDHMKRVTSFVYDGFGARAQVVAPNGGVWSFVNNQYHECLTTSDPCGGTRTQKFDDRGFLVERIQPSGERIEIARDARGNPIKVQTSTETVTFEYDSWSRPVRLVTKDGSEARFAYDRRGLRTHEWDAEGNLTRYEYDGEGNPTAVYLPDNSVRRGRYGGLNWLCEYIDELGRTSKFQFDHEGDLLRIVSPSHQVYEYSYDMDGNIIEERRPDGSKIRHEYDPTGRLTRSVFPDRQRMTREYDPAGNLVRQSYDDGTEDEFRYDSLDYVVEAKSEDATVFLERDLCGRIVNETFETRRGLHSIESTFDSAGRRVGRSTRNHSVRLTMDSAGRILSREFDGKPRHRVSTSADARVTSRTLPTGTRIEKRVDALRRLTEQRVVPFGSSDVGMHVPTTSGLGQSFAYTTRGELAMKQDSRFGTTHYDYDATGQLLARTENGNKVEEFWYDAEGNVTPLGKSAQRADDNRIVSFDNASLKWDPAGFLIEKSVLGVNGAFTWRYEWNAAGSLTSVERPDGSCVVFTYDAFGRRLSKAAADGSSATSYVWDGNSLAREVRQRGSYEEDRVYYFTEEDAFVPLCERVNGTWYEHVNSPVGTAQDLVDDAGRIAWSIGLLCYGQVEREDRVTTDSPLRFQGQHADEETGLHYNRFRYYDPQLGIYIASDPLGLAAGLNLYQYTRNPIGWADPLGLENGAALTRAMGGNKPAGFQAHHIVPEELFGSHPLLAGLNPHTPENGIYLPQYADDWDEASHSGRSDCGRTIHRGRHNPDYIDPVRAELDREQAALERQFGDQPIPPCQRQAAARRVMDKFRTRLQAGSVRLNAADATANRP